MSLLWWCLFFFISDPKDPIAIERLNLMNMAKLSIKGLIESALNLGRTLDSDYAPLQQFFVVMEHCLKHGLKSMYVIPAHFKMENRCTLDQNKFLLYLVTVSLLSLMCEFSIKTNPASRPSAKKTFLGQNKSFWGALELVEKLTPEAGEITASVKDLPGLRWVRLSTLHSVGHLCFSGVRSPVTFFTKFKEQNTKNHESFIYS